MSERRPDLSQVSDEQMRDELSWRSHLRLLRSAVESGIYFCSPIPCEDGWGLLVLGGRPSVMSADALEATAAFLREQVRLFENARVTDKDSAVSLAHSRDDGRRELRDGGGDRRG